MLSIHLFGPLTLTWQGTALAFSTLPKVPALLAYLLLNRHTAITREQLAFALWMDVGESVAKGNLRRHLYDLNRALPANVEWVVREGDTLQWNPRVPYWLDVAAFEQTSHTDRAQAVEFYKGILLPTTDEEWLYPERERYHALFYLTATRLMEQYALQGQLPDALAVAQRLLGFDPLREEVVRRMMAYRYALGDRAGALQTYQQFAALLDHEMGVPPMPESQAVRDKILKNAPVKDVVGQPPSSIPGELSLSVPLPDNRVPTPLRRTIGRELEIEKIARWLHNGTRLITLTGPAGVGKSHLAQAVAHYLTAQKPSLFQEGLYYVPLSPVQAAPQVLPAIAAAFHITPDGATPLLDRLIEYLRYRRTLIVVDNFEHLLAAATGIHILLQSAPRVQVLATSQSPLALQGEQEFVVTPLSSTPRKAESVATRSANATPAVALFCEVAQSTHPAFELTPDNVTAVTTICHTLDGLPLAIELAAARSKMYSPAVIQAQLSDSLDFLASRAPDTSDRHRTMQAALEWSYRLLPSYEQKLLARVAVCANGFGIDAAHAVGADTESRNATAPALENLIHRSFLRIMSTKDGTTRFEWLHTLRLFALAKLVESSEAEAAHERHAYYYATLATVSEEQRDNHFTEIVTRFLEEQRNLSQAADYLLAHPSATSQWSAGIDALISRLSEIAQHSGQISNTRLRVAQLLNHRATMQPPELIRLLVTAMTLAMRQNDLDAADTYGGEARLLAEATGNALLLGLALSVNATLEMLRENYTHAIMLGTEALRLQAPLPMGQTKAATVQTLAIVYKYVGQYKEAFRLLDELLYHAHSVNDTGRIASVLINIGSTYTAQDAFEQAEVYYWEALQFAMLNRFRRGILGCVSALAQAAHEQKQYAHAVRLFGAQHSYRLQLGFTSSAVHRREEAATLATIRHHLSPTDFNRAWYDGMAMNEAEMVQYALD